MPDAAVHGAFGQEVRRELPEEIRQLIRNDPYTFTLFGPDIWFLFEPWKHREGRGRRMHTTRTGDFLMALVRRVKVSRDPESLFSYLAGFLCHYALDSTAHPYVIHVTEEQYHYPRCHTSFEHSLDIAEMERAGVWGEKHPVTDHYLVPVKLPESIRQDVDAVYEEIYGWKNCWQASNIAYGRFRFCFRRMENAGGTMARLARGTKHPMLKSYAYSESHFQGMDVENREHREWRHSHAPEQRSTEDFAALRKKALARALEMIEGAYRFLFRGEGTEEELSALIGSFSYLSGLPTEDPRNWDVPSMLPPENSR